MRWVKLSTTFYLDAAIVRAGEPAEVLFVRAMAWCGDQENDGMVPVDMLPRLTPTRGQHRAAALVREGLWEVVPGGWRFVSWSDWQQTAEDAELSREAGRRRQAKWRAEQRRRAAEADRRNGVSNAVVTEQSRAEQDQTAAAAADAEPLHPSIAVLQSRMQAYTKLRALRFDALDDTQTQRLLDLIALHGDDRLVHVALDTCRATPPVLVQAFLGTWESLPAPGQRLRAVEQQFCTEHTWQRRSPAGVCPACQSERKAAQ